MAYDNERIGKAIKAHLVADLPAQLDVVEAAWTATDPLALPEPVTWFEGYKPTVLEMAQDEFPYVGILVPVREVGTGKAQWGYQGQMVHAFVDFAVCAEDEATANKMGYRYAEALCLTLKRSASFAGFTQVNYEPPVSLVSFTRHLKDPANADAFSADDVYYLALKSIAVDLTG